MEPWNLAKSYTSGTIVLRVLAGGRGGNDPHLQQFKPREAPRNLKGELGSSSWALMVANGDAYPLGCSEG